MFNRFFLRGSTLEVLPPPIRISRPGQLATSAGLTRLPDGRFLTIVLTQPGKTTVQVDAHISASRDLRDGFVLAPSWTDQVPLGTLDHYQSISLLTDAAGEVFLIGLGGQKKGRIDVYLLGPGLGAPAQWVRFISIAVDVGPADLSAGGTVALIQGALCLTATAKFRAVKTKQLSFTQIAPPLLAAAPIPLTPVG